MLLLQAHYLEWPDWLPALMVAHEIGLSHPFIAKGSAYSL